jgi:hypothetical protein
MSAHHLTNGHAPSMILSVEESLSLRACETIIEKGLQTFVEVGNALLNIREARLYRQDFATFEDYCRGRWTMVRRQADRLIQAAEVAENLRPIGLIPTSESQIRPLTKLEPEQQRDAWQTATRLSPKPTAGMVAKIVEKAIAEAAAKNEKSIYGEVTAILAKPLSELEKQEQVRMAARREREQKEKQEREIKARHLFIILGTLALGKQPPSEIAMDLLDYDKDTLEATQLQLTTGLWQKAIETLKECASQWEGKN